MDTAVQNQKAVTAYSPSKQLLHFRFAHQNTNQAPLHEVSIVESLRDREVACSASDRQGSNFESCVWRTVSSHSSHHPQDVLLAQFSLYVHKGGLKPDSFHLPLHDQHWFDKLLNDTRLISFMIFSPVVFLPVSEVNIGFQ